MKALLEKIERYEAYLAEDKKLVKAHPDKQSYANRLRNHQDKLARMKEKLDRYQNPEPEPEPHPGITHQQYLALEKACRAYESSITTRDDFYTLTLCNEAEGPVSWEEAISLSFSVYDFDGKHDYSWLYSMLQEAGIPEPTWRETVSGDALYAGDVVPLYGYELKLIK